MRVWGEGSRAQCPGLRAHSFLGIISLSLHNHMSLNLLPPFHRGGNRGSVEPRLGAGLSESEACVCLAALDGERQVSDQPQGNARHKAVLFSLERVWKLFPCHLMRSMYLLPPVVAQ